MFSIFIYSAVLEIGGKLFLVIVMFSIFEIRVLVIFVVRISSSLIPAFVRIFFVIVLFPFFSFLTIFTLTFLAFIFFLHFFMIDFHFSSKFSSGIDKQAISFLFFFPMQFLYGSFYHFNFIFFCKIFSSHFIELLTLESRQ